MNILLNDPRLALLEQDSKCWEPQKQYREVVNGPKSSNDCLNISQVTRGEGELGTVTAPV